MQLAGLRNGKQPFRVLDMACGSGSFLLGAYQCLFDHCLKWYTEHSPERHKAAVWNGNGRAPVKPLWRLTIGEKKRILTSHIFGIDIDSQAVEVSKLSLLLKVLEGETNESLRTQQQRALFEDRALPNLADNIKCGNSLIGPDYFTGKLVTDPDELRRVNAFDWSRGFPAAMQAGGFYCIIGNPPYVRVRTLKEVHPQQAGYLEAVFDCAVHVWDVYLLFFEQAVRLARQGGAVSLIVPIQTLHQPNCESLRRYLLRNTRIRERADLSNLRVFEGPVVKNCILTCDKTRPGKGSIRIRVPDCPDDLAADRK